MAGIQGGFLIAGALVGFIYNSVGLGGVLVIDALTYVFSFSCYFFVRRGKHLVAPQAETAEQASNFFHELQEGFRYLKSRKDFIPIGLCWSLFLSAMMSQGVVTAPASERLLHAGAIGFGWLNAGWGIGAFLSAAFAVRFILKRGAQWGARWSMAALALVMVAAPFSRWLVLAVALWFVAGCARGIGGIALNSEFMEQIPKHLMGRIQNVFFFIGTALQVLLAMAIGGVAHRVSLTLAFAMVGVVYAAAFAMTLGDTRVVTERREIAAASSL